MGDKPYSGKKSGRIPFCDKCAGQAWQGDVAGRHVRGRNFSSKKSIEGQPILAVEKEQDRFGDRAYRGKSGWYQTISGKSRPGKGPLPPEFQGLELTVLENFRAKSRGEDQTKVGEVSAEKPGIMMAERW